MLRRSSAVALAIVVLAPVARAQVPDDHSNIRSSAATTIVVDSAVVAGTIEVAGDRDWFKFTLAANRRYTAFTTTLGVNMDTVIDVYTPSGGIIGRDDDGGGGLASRLHFSSTTAGTYYLRVIHARASGTGTYAVGVRTPTAPDPTQPTMDAARALQVVAGPSLVAFGDLDADGRIDAVVAGRSGLQVVRSDANGILSAGPVLRSPVRAQSLSVADVGGDSLPDILFSGVADDEATLSLLSARGRASFTKPRVAAFAGFPRAGDVDRDGRVDLVALDRTTRSLALYRQDPTSPGEFFDPVKLVDQPSGDPAGAFCLADLDADGRLDIADADGRVLLQSTSMPGRFVAAPGLIWPVGTTPSYVAGLAAADLDRDGRVDLVVVTREGQSRLILFRGDPSRPGAFMPGVATLGPSSIPRPSEVTVVDLNGDGTLDVLAGAAHSYLHFLQDPARPGVFTATQRRDLVAAADLTGDGRTDVLQLDPLTGVASMATAGSMSPEALETVGDHPGKPVVADVDGDGFMDVITLEGTGAVWFHQSDVTRPGQFLRGVLLAIVTDYAAAEIADLNGDRRPDVVVTDPEHESVIVLLQTAVAGQFAAPVRYASGAKNPLDVAIGDLNGDGRPDLVVANLGYSFKDDAVGVLLQSTGGRFNPVQAYGHPVIGAGPRTVAIGDVDGDGRVDIAAGYYTVNQMGVLRQDPLNRGRFLPVVTVPASELPETIAVVDMDLDGRKDIVAGHRNRSTIMLWHGQAGALIGPPTSLTVPGGSGADPGVWDFEVTDVNRDGMPDLAVASGGVLVSFFLGDPTSPRRLVTGASYRTGGVPFGLAARDLDRDGDVDLVVAHRFRDGGATSSCVVVRGR